MHGEVVTWFMTEEERLAYIAKHPIVPTEMPKGVAYSKYLGDERRKNLERNKDKEVIKAPTVMDKVDKEELHQMFVEGATLAEMADYFDVTLPSLSRYILAQRKIEPDKWPSRNGR